MKKLANKVWYFSILIIFIFVCSFTACSNKQSKVPFENKIDKFVKYYSDICKITISGEDVNGIMFKAKENSIKEVKLKIRANKPFIRDGLNYYPTYEFLAYKYNNAEECKKSAQKILWMQDYTNEMYKSFLNGKDKNINIKWGHFIIVVNKDEIFYLDIQPACLAQSWLEEKEKYKDIFMDIKDKNAYFFEYWPVYLFENFKPHWVVGGNDIYYLERHGKSYRIKRK